MHSNVKHLDDFFLALAVYGHEKLCCNRGKVLER